MTFFVEKKLALGSIRFSVGRRRNADVIDQNRQLSTGPTGEFIRRRNEGFYFGGHDRFIAPALPEAASVRSTPFWSSLAQHRGLLALAAVGAVIVLLGLIVLTKPETRTAGVIEVLFGIAMIGVPIGITAQERKQLRDTEERQRAEREEAENRRKQMLAGYTAALERVQNDHGEEALQQLVNEHPDLPYNVWSSAARRVVLLIGFRELADAGVARADQVARVMDRVSRAAGLTPEHETQAKIDLYDAVVWHLLADDRLGPTQQEELLALRKGFGIWDRDVAEDTKKAVEQFDRLRGITTANVPHLQQCSTQLGFKEYCVHQSQADAGLLHITNKRLLVQAKKKQDHTLPSLSDVTVIVDDDTVAMRAAAAKKPLHFRVEDPIYTAAMIDIASSIDERPKGFA